MGTFLYGIQLGSCMSALHLARSFIQCHLSPVRSVHHPDNFETPLSLARLSRAGTSCQFRCGCLTGPWGMLSNIWDTKYEMHSSLADIEPHAEFHSSYCHQCVNVVVPTITSLEKCLHRSIRSLPLEHGILPHMLPSPSLACESTRFTRVWPLPCTSNFLEP